MIFISIFKCGQNINIPWVRSLKLIKSYIHFDCYISNTDINSLPTRLSVVEIVTGNNTR